MTNLEWMMPIFVALLALGSGAILFFALRAEYRLACRKQIKLANYREKNYLFYTRRDIPVIVIAGILGLCALTLAVISIVLPVLFIYLIPLALLLGVNGIAVYFSLSRHKYDRDIRVFDAYYVQVADLLDSKEHTLYDMEVCRKRVKELHGKLSEKVESFNRNLTQPISPNFLNDLFAPVSKMVQEYMREIERFSVEIERDFDNALKLFLHEEVQPELRVVPLRDFDSVVVDDLLDEIKTSYGTQVAEMVIAQVERGAITNAVALGNVMTLLHELGVQVEGKTLVQFLRAASSFADRNKLAEVLYRNKQIPATMVREVIIPENWEWMFAGGMTAAYNVREQTAILTELLATDRAALCYRFLSQMDGSAAPVLEQALQNEKERAGAAEPNTATKQAQAFALLLGNEYAVGNAGSIFENLALMLWERAGELGLSQDEFARLGEIVRGAQFLQSRREIGLLYTRSAQAGKPLCESATRILLQYIINPPAKEQFLDPKRLADLFGEYRFTLSFADIATMRALVGAWLLCRSEDLRVKEAVLREFALLPPALPLWQGCTPQNAAAFGSALITHLAREDRVRLRSVIYRTESTRLALDHVLTLCEKGDVQ